MNANDKLKNTLVNLKCSHWYCMAHAPNLSPEMKRRARRNYWKLVRNNAKIAKQLGWTEERILETPTVSA